MFKLVLLSFLILNVYAQDDTDLLMKSLEDDLKEYTNIATNTKQNVDYMPYVVSVLNNEDLTSLGILSLREAIVLIPGVEISVGMVGAQTTIFRGSNPYSMGQSALIIDGTVVNNQMFGAYNQYLDMPIDIIERIEITRGPGSIQGGVNAYAGSINVITKANKDNKDNKDNMLFAALGSNNYKMGGFIGSYDSDDLEISSDLFYQKHDKTNPVGTDQFNTPATDAELWIKNYALGLNLKYKNFYIHGRFQEHDGGISYGQQFTISTDKTDNLKVKNNSLKTGYSTKIADGVLFNIFLGYIDESRKLQNKVIPSGVPAKPPLGQYMLADHSVQTYSQQLEFEISSLENHKIKTGALFTQSKINNNTMSISTNNLAILTTSELLSRKKRNEGSFYINDLVDLDEKTSLDLGLQLDHFSDVSNQLTPRIAIVHRYDDENIFKLMYTRSYREPSFRELYLNATAKPSSNLALKPEKVNAYEAAYIRKLSKNSDFRLNLFYLENKDQINSDNNASTLSNIKDNELYGLELEIKTNITSKDKLYVSYAYVDGKNVDDALANTTQNMIKAYYIYNFNKDFTASSIVKYMGEKDRVSTDTRASVDDYFVADLTMLYKHKLSDSLISFSIKNLFDETYYFPAPKGTYANDLPQEGRSFLIRLQKSF